MAIKIMTLTDFQIECKIWINSQDGSFLGQGRIELLKMIEKYGSISKAAKEMKMSYKKAWELVNSMNARFPKPLVVGSIGGVNGGGSCLSSTGKHLIYIYESIVESNKVFLESELKKLNYVK